MLLLMRCFLSVIVRNFRIIPVDLDNKSKYDLQNLQEGDTNLFTVIRNIQCPEERKGNGTLMERDLYNEHLWRIMIPKSLVPTIIRNHHDDRGHFRSSKTHSMIIENYFGETMYIAVPNYEKNCVLCQQHKSDVYSTYRRLEMVEVNSVREIVAVDLVGNYRQKRKDSHTYV